MLSSLLVGSGQRMSASRTLTPGGTVNVIGAARGRPLRRESAAPAAGALTFSVTDRPSGRSRPSAR